MSEHRTLRAAIVAVLKSVPKIGKVFEFERYAKTDKDFKDVYAPSGQLLGWHVRRVARRESAATNEVLTTWEIRGFMALEDSSSSELAFDDLLDAIGDAFRADATLGGVALYPKDDGSAVPELVDAGPVMFTGTLCHSARLKAVTRSVLDAPRPWE